MEDEVTAYLEWENGATGVFTASTGEAPGVNRLEIAMDDGLIICQPDGVRICRLDRPETEARTTFTDPFAAPSGTWENFPMESEPDAYAKLLENFALAVNSGRSDNLFAPWGEARKSLLISNAVYLSSWEGGTVTIPLPGSEEELLFETRFEEQLRKLQ